MKVTTFMVKYRKPSRLLASTALVLLVAVLGASFLVGLRPAPAGAATFDTGFNVHSGTVAALPTSKTPHAANGSVRDVAVTSDTVFMVGDFTAAANPDKTAVDRKYILAYDRATGLIKTTFNPILDGMVSAIVPAPDGQSLFIGGAFATVNGVRAAKLARISLTDGSLIKFPAYPNAAVTALAFVGGRLWVGGLFSTFNGIADQRIVALDPATAKVDTKVAITVGGVQGNGKIWKIEVSPNGRSVVLIGVFTRINGQDRYNAAKFNVAPDNTVTLSSWSTHGYKCGWAGFWVTASTAAFSPDNSYFVIGATGGPTGLYCDTTVRFENNETTGASATWIATSPGDSFYSAEITGTSVYVGGHFKGVNQSVREGIAEVSAMTGKTLSWNPGRARGRAAWEIRSTNDGIFVLSDTDRIARFLYRGRIAFFPLAGGTPYPKPELTTLPVSLNRFVPSSTVLGVTKPAEVASVKLSDAGVGAPAALGGDPADMTNTSSSWRVGSKLFTTHSDGSLKQRSFDGTTLGVPTPVTTVPSSTQKAEFAIMRGAYYMNGSVYFVVPGRATLYSRTFDPATGTLGATLVTVDTDPIYTSISGIEAAGNFVYYTSASDGKLYRTPLDANGAVASKIAVVVSDKIAEGLDWGRAGSADIWASPVTKPPFPNQAPTATLTVKCAGFECVANATASKDADGTIAVHRINWGDRTAEATTASASHIYTATGTFTVTLTVVDNRGALGTATAIVNPAAIPIPKVTFVAAASSTGITSATKHTVSAPTGVTAGDQLLLFVSTNSVKDTPVATPTGWTLAKRVDTAGSVHVVFAKAAVAGDTGAAVTVELSTTAKADLTYAAYRGGTAKTASGSTGYVATSLTGATGQLGVYYWADKSSTTTAITPAAGLTTRITRAQAGIGHLAELLADGPTGLPKTATVVTPTSNAAAISILLG